MKRRKVSGVWLTDYQDFLERLKEAEVEESLAYGLLTSAIDYAKKNNGFGWASSKDLMITCDLDEKRRAVLYAEIYKRKAVYRDKFFNKEVF
jgi:hypothetical protein